MRFVTYAEGTAGAPGDAADRAGVLRGDRVYALPPGVTLRGLLGDDGERLHGAGEQALRDPRDVVSLRGVRLRVVAATAERHIAGYCLLNDRSARDLQFAEMEVRLGPAKGKGTSLTLGHMLVTPGEPAPHRSGTAFDLGMAAVVSGEVIGTDRRDSMHFSYPEMIERPGDTVTISGDRLGGITSRIVTYPGPRVGPAEREVADG
ncbi:fumarylacetoacetate hydrolase family protein [Actinomadura madurae]|uniref:fumarylacetoacetate hydrolase family protein n=1 Tax=Actinomadura madurae TaxID=1993 RepID=UPI000D87B70F|nr:fumarylacetoacetate hydrolase family protein [Actinomadura madurae]SPT63998.1 2-keto-4-pentenoate hydratase/2-oxohepta-3-ene-1,7-dioic acid hydratase (catechol pathway) [Actinomadura madurae]